MTIHINVPLEVLNWVNAQIDMTTIPDRLGSLLKSWTQGEQKPTFEQLEEMSHATGIQLGYFLMRSPLHKALSFMKYRTLHSDVTHTPSRSFIDNMIDMRLIQDWMHSYLTKEEDLPVDYLGIIKDKLSYDDAAQKVREVLKLQPDWYTSSQSTDESFRLIRQAISDARTLVMLSGTVGSNPHRLLDIAEFRAFCIVDDYAPLIFINSNDSVESQLFALVHEFVHICLCQNCLFNDRYGCVPEETPEEAWCKAVAAEILVPKQDFLDKLPEVHEPIDQTLETLANCFKCGIPVLARKAYDHKLIDRDKYQELANLAAKNHIATVNSFQSTEGAANNKAGESNIKEGNFNAKDVDSNNKDGDDFYKTAASRLDRHFFQALLSSVKESKTLYIDAFRLTNSDRETFDKLVQYIENHQ